MARIDRRQRLALDEAYKIYLQIIKGERKADLYQLANCLTTLKSVLTEDTSSQFKLTKRLWQRTFESLCDLLITSFPVYLIIYNSDNEIQLPGAPVAEPATVEIHAEGLRRKSDVFRLDFDRLNPLTKEKIMNLWLTGGPLLHPEDFNNLDCGEFYVPKNLLVGEEVLQNESEFGRERAYKKWWDLYWQAYCANIPLERQAAQEEMYLLEKVWGNLYY